MSCGCIERIDADLKPLGQCLNATILQDPRKALINLVRTDIYGPETRRGRVRFVIATFCPFCGERYEAVRPDEARVIGGYEQLVGEMAARGAE